MSFRAKRELLVQVAPRYRAPRHGQRSAILDEFVAVTGYERKYAIPAAARSDPTTRTHPSTTNSTVRRRRATSAGHRVHGRQRDLWQAFGAVPDRVDPHTRASWPSVFDQRGARATPHTQPGDGGSAAGSAAPATRLDHDEARPAAQEV